MAAPWGCGGGRCGRRNAVVERRGGCGVPSICADQHQPVDNFVGILRARGCGLWRTLHYSVLLLARYKKKNAFKSNGCVNIGSGVAVLWHIGAAVPDQGAAARAMCIS